MADKTRIEISIGDPKSDGDFLIKGFGVPMAVGGRLCRGVNQEALMFLPGSRGVENHVTLELRATPPQKLTLLAGGRALGKADFDKPDWKAATFTIPAAAVGKNGLVPLSFRFDSFNAGPSWVPSCGHLAGAVVEAEGGEPPAAARPEPVPDYKVYFGDPHGHSDFSFCDKGKSGSPEENYRWARDEAGLDFCALADHAEHMSDDVWREAQEICDSFNAPGSFVTIPTFEWTSELFGHQNVYYRESGGAQFGSVHPATNTPHKLWDALKEQGRAAITVPHHPSRIEFTTAWGQYDPDFQPVAEIYSKWGASEHYGNIRQEPHKTVIGCFIQNALARGFRFGFVGGSDGHVLMVGSRGLTAVFSEKLDRGGVFDAIKQRRCYATTGARIGIDFRLRGRAFMGEELILTPYQSEALYPLVLYVSVAPTAPIEKVELIESNEVIYTYTFTTGGGHPGYHSDILKPLAERNGLERVSFTYVINHPRKTWVPLAGNRVLQPVRWPTWDRYFYVRVSQADGNMAWSSPIWLTVVPREDGD